MVSLDSVKFQRFLHHSTSLFSVHLGLDKRTPSSAASTAFWTAQVMTDAANAQKGDDLQSACNTEPQGRSRYNDESRSKVFGVVGQ